MNSNLLVDSPRPSAAAPVLRTKAELRAAVAAAKRDGKTVGLVPTMGYLHEGHLSLIRAARAECDLVVMSLFVNPTQFGPGEDLDRYPRDEERDLRLAAEAGADLVFAPGTEEVYAADASTAVEVTGPLTGVLDGDPTRRGPEHFRGVTTVVAKLFNLVDPDVAYFGQKDAQQAVVIRRMARDLDFPVRIEVLPTVREADGLAMSSRNAYLEPADRERADRAPPRPRRRRARRPRRARWPPASTPPAPSWPPPRSSPSTSRPATRRRWRRSRSWAPARSWSPSPPASAPPA